MATVNKDGVTVSQLRMHNSRSLVSGPTISWYLFIVLHL